MADMNAINAVLSQHIQWLNGVSTGKRADLSGMDLTGINLFGVDLSRAKMAGVNLSLTNLYRATLNGADLTGARMVGTDLSHASLFGAVLTDAYMEMANLPYADMNCAFLINADLTQANLSSSQMSVANLTNATLYGANLTRAKMDSAVITDAKFSPFQICPETGAFTAWKKLQDNKIAELLIPAAARRTSTLVGRKCRAEYVEVVSITNENGNTCKAGKARQDGTPYIVGQYVHPDSYNPDIRVECTHGIHFFVTRAEAWTF